MDDLIRRKDALQAIAQLPLPYGVQRDKIITALYEVPAVDAAPVNAVEVVRCRDCAVPHNKWTGCPNLNGLIPPPEHFCARGERRNNHE